MIEDEGKPQPIRLWAWTGKDEEPVERSAVSLDVAVVLDVSASMSGVAGIAREAAVRFLTLAPWARNVSLVLFSEQVTTVYRLREGRPTPAPDPKEVTPGRGARLFDAVCHAVSEMKDGEGRRALVLISAGVDSASKAVAGEAAGKASVSGVVVYSVGWFRSVTDDEGNQVGPAGRVFLHDLARDSGGRLFKLESGKALEQQLGVIREELRGQYVLGFEPFVQQTVSWRKIKVSVRRKGLKVRSRRYYLAGTTYPVTYECGLRHRGPQ